nr:hypothetical protein [Tanacetum cinerariifolium]GEZ56630.1 hypothetical protein [Tanacetum cinerariifolium]
MKDGLDEMLKNSPWFIRNNPLILKKWHLDANLLKEDVGTIPVWVKLHGVHVTAFNEDGLSGRSSYARAMIELRADMELKNNIVVAMPKINGDGYYTCNIRVDYEWKPSTCVCCKVFGHVQEECPKNIGVGEPKNQKKTSETLKCIPVGQKNVDTSSPSATPIIAKIDKIKKLIIDGKVTLVDDEGNFLEKVVYSGDYNSEDEVASVDNEMASFLAKKDGYGTQSLLEQWNESYENDDYKYDPYDDDMYERQEIPENLQAICGNLDITVRGRRKK